MKHGVPELAAGQIKKEQGIDKYTEEGWQTKEKKSLGCPVPVHLRHLQTHRRVQVRRPALLARDPRGRNEKGTKKVSFSFA